LSVIVSNGNPKLVHDGATFETIDDAVKGNPAAEAFAHKSKVHAYEAAGAYVASMLCLVAGAFVFGRATTTSTPAAWERPVTFGLLGGSFGLLELAGAARSAASADWWDAVNAYNDAAEAR
jgi:hypothetical protein